MSAQDFSKHKWENRLVVIYSDSPKNDSLKNQLEILSQDLDGLDERKIIVYKIFPEEFSIGLREVTTPIKKTKNDLKDVSFKIDLIGLDGGVKLSQQKLLSVEKLFGVIDQMPMRRIEMKNKKY